LFCSNKAYFIFNIDDTEYILSGKDFVVGVDVKGYLAFSVFNFPPKLRKWYCLSHRREPTSISCNIISLRSGI
jgi:hypothetical protein